ncbi:hypothetical protein BDW62DRAFT_173900 [Aspergillus aurantiobrunneus]
MAVPLPPTQGPIFISARATTVTTGGSEPDCETLRKSCALSHRGIGPCRPAGCACPAIGSRWW